MTQTTENVDSETPQQVLADEFRDVPSLSDQLGTDESMWYKRRLSMEDIVGKEYIVTRAEWRERKTGGYYILHLTNQMGAQGTVTTSAPAIKNKVNALINRECFPVRVSFTKDGASFNMVNPGS